MISHRCSLCSPRVAGRLAFPASSLALPSARLPGRNGPSRSSARHRRPTRIAASLPSTLSSAPLRSSRLLPGPAHADLLSWGWTRTEGHPCRLCPSPLRRPSFRTPLSRSPRASTPGLGLSPSSFGLGMPLPKSRSVLVVSHHLDGFLRARLAGLLHPAADPGVRLVSCPAETAHSPRRYHPSKKATDPPWALRSPGALAPLMFPLSRGCHLRGCFRRIDSVTPTPVAGRRCPVLPGLLSPLRGCREIVFPLVLSSPRAGRGTHPPSLAGKQAS